MGSNLNKCQLCNSKELDLIIDLGHHPPSDAFLSEAQLNGRESIYPLRVFFCQNCMLVQLNYVVDPKTLFGPNYVYMSGINKALKEHLQSIPKDLCEQYQLGRGSLVVDIGSNDGTLLEGYGPYGMTALGVEPSLICEEARRKGINTINEFFDENLARRIRKKYGPAKAITATNVFAHVKDLSSFVRGVKLLLDDDGVFLTESHYLLDLLEKLEYVEIYLEHLRYYSLQSLVNLFKQFDMVVIDAKRVQTHGGSVRCIASKPGARPVSDAVGELIRDEENLEINSEISFDSFRKGVLKHRTELMELLWSLKSKGHRIAGIPAPAKGNTLLNFCRIGPELLDYVAEKNALKIGQFTPGTHIKIVDEAKFIKDQPEYALLLSWDIKDVLIPKLRKGGYRGKFVVPIPSLQIID